MAVAVSSAFRKSLIQAVARGVLREGVCVAKHREAAL